MSGLKLTIYLIEVERQRVDAETGETVSRRVVYRHMMPARKRAARVVLRSFLQGGCPADAIGVRVVGESEY